MSLKGKLVAVTGGNGNLGRAVARAASAAGGAVALVDLAFGADIASAVPGASHHVADLLDAAAAKAAFDRIGRVEVLLNIAGGFAMGDPVHTTPDAVWSRMFDLNTRTMLNAVRAVVPGMVARKHGKIVNIGANAARAGQANMGAYTASKAVVIRLTEAMSAELRKDGINVNCVLPSIIDTPQNRADMPGADPKIWVSPEDLAAVIVFLASDAARAVHGAAIPVVNLV